MNTPRQQMIAPLARQLSAPGRTSADARGDVAYNESTSAGSVIRQYVLGRISEQAWSIGDRLPTDEDLARQFEVSRSTVNQTMKQLEHEGFVRRYRRRGTFVAKVPAAAANEALNRNNPSRGCVHVVAPLLPAHASMHWNRSTLDQLETTFNATGMSVVHRSMPDYPSPEVFKDFIDGLAAENSRAVVLLIDLVKLLPESRLVPKKQKRLQGSSRRSGKGLAAGDVKSGLMMRQDDSNNDVKEHLWPYINALRGYSGKICWLNRVGVSLTNWPYDAVSFSPLNEGVMVGEYLIEQGVRHVNAIVRNNKSWGLARHQGMMLRLAASAQSPTVVEYTSDTHQAMYALLDQVLPQVQREAKRPTFVVSNDQFAAAMLERAAKLGLNCPEDFCVISFDNDDHLRHHNITTVAPPAGHLGEVMAQLVCDQIRRPSNAAIHMALKSVIVERSTFTTAKHNNGFNSRNAT